MKKLLFVASKLYQILPTTADMHMALISTVTCELFSPKPALVLALTYSKDLL